MLAFPNRVAPMPTSLLLTYEDESLYLHADAQGCTLFRGDSPEPVYLIQDSLLLAHGIMTDAQTTHLVTLKTTGELCYTLVSSASAPQTTLIAKLDVQASHYQRLYFFPQGNKIHIFYAHTHQAIRDLWHIDHCYWDGSAWRSVHLGEVVHPREPLYHVSLDSQGNLHLLFITFQGQHSLLFTNRFNGTFHLWGTPIETLKIPGEVVDSSALMTSDNVHHLFWVAKTANRQLEVRWAQQPNAHELTSTWHPSPAPIKTLVPTFKKIGALEINGLLWLLVHSGEESLLQYDGTGWKLFSAQAAVNRPCKWVHRGKRNFHQTYWPEDQRIRRTPAYSQELDLGLKQDSLLASPPPHSQSPVAIQVIPPVQDHYPHQSSPDPPPPAFAPPAEPERTETPPEPINPPDTQRVPGQSAAPEAPDQENAPAAQAPVILEHLISTVAQLEQENGKLKLDLQDALAKFEQNQILDTMSNLEKETESLSQVLRVMMTKQEQSDLVIENLTTQISQLQEEKKDKGGFWAKWMT